MKRLLVPLIISASPTAAFSEGASYICLTELSTGFKIDASGKRWESVNFHASSRFLVRPLRLDEYGYNSTSGVEAYGVFEFGTKYAAAQCRQGFSYYLDGKLQTSNWLYCDGFNSFKLNSDTLRFIATYTVGFTNSHPGSEQKDGDTPSISIGSCSKM
ncbi:hypothetical protein [Phaeobacter sp. S60]|uniref:hypothetical protein n=1 Tax=Phaeobacter sp. S60 TaxID=1569353 RepID=UPI0011123049|nr:hypothetical protein [Phaeobacter sp. S60]